MIKRLCFSAHFSFFFFFLFLLFISHKEELAEKLGGRKSLVDTRTS